MCVYLSHHTWADKCKRRADVGKQMLKHTRTVQKSKYTQDVEEQTCGVSRDSWMKHTYFARTNVCVCVSVTQVEEDVLVLNIYRHTHTLLPQCILFSHVTLPDQSFSLSFSLVPTRTPSLKHTLSLRHPHTLSDTGLHYFSADLILTLTYD